MYPLFNHNLQRYRIADLDGGVVIDKGESKIPDNCASDMLNMIYSEGALKKRKGQELLFDENDIITSLKDSYYDYFIYHASDKIKAYNINTKESITLMGPVNKREGKFFIYNGYVYYVGTGEYYKISKNEDGLSCQVVSGYIPNVMVNCDINSIGDEYESYNFLTGSFKLSYVTTSQTKIINLPSDLSVNSLDSLYVTFNSKELTDYTLDKNKRCIIFNSMEEGHNLLEIIFYIKNEEDRAKITNCNISESFGGLSAGISEGTRIFLSGNPDYKTTIFYSELKNPEYFPINQFDIIGDDADPITGMGKQYNGLVIFKERSIYISGYEFSGDTVNFTLSKINSGIGCDCKNTIVSVGNQLVWLNGSHGVLTLTSTYIKEEKNVKCISLNINGMYSEKALLNQENLIKSVAFTLRDALYIVTGKYTYVFPFEYVASLKGNSPWYIFDNISCTAFSLKDREIYLFGKKGITRFVNKLYDFDLSTPINAYFKTKAIDFNRPGDFKNIHEITFGLRSVQNSYFLLKVWDENGRVGADSEYKVNKFNFVNFKFPLFTFKGNLFSFAINRRIKRARTKYLMLEFSNNLPDSQMNISDILITYLIERRVRFNGI